MKLTQEPCPACHHITEKDNPTCSVCGQKKPLTLDQKWSQGFGTIGRTFSTVSRSSESHPDPQVLRENRYLN